MIGIALAAIALQRGPVVESVLPRSAVISFTTSRAVDATVAVGDAAPDVAGGERQHSIRVTGLVPGRRYRYAVVVGGNVLARGNFRAAPVGPAHFTFAVVGDFGTGGKPQRAVAKLMQSWHPDFLLSTGDQSYLLGTDALLEQNIFRPYRDLFRGTAFFPTLGNHDVYLNDGRPELAAFHWPGGKRWYRFAWGSAAFTVLDSDVDVEPASAQGRFAAQSFARGSCFRFAAWHHPPWSEHSGGIAPHLRNAIVPLAERNGLDVVFLGHVHSYERTHPRNGVTYVTVGTGGATLGASPSSIPVARAVPDTYGALRVEVTGRRAVFRFIASDGRVLDAFARTCTVSRP